MSKNLNHSRSDFIYTYNAVTQRMEHNGKKSAAAAVGKKPDYRKRNKTKVTTIKPKRATKRTK